MRLLAFTLLVASCLTVSCSRKDTSWYVLDATEVIVAEIEIVPHSTTPLDLQAAHPFILRIQTDASFELAEKYNFSKRLPIRLEHRKSIEAIATVRGAGGTVFAPVNGTIPLLVRNETDSKLKVIISRKK